MKTKLVKEPRDWVGITYRPTTYELTEEDKAHMENITNDLQKLIDVAKFDAIHQEVRLPEYIQLELDFMDEMFERRMEDPRA